MSDLRKNCNQGQQKQTLRISSPPRLLDRPKTPACLGLKNSCLLQLRTICPYHVHYLHTYLLFYADVPLFFKAQDDTLFI